MAVVVVGNKLTKVDVDTSREHYQDYIKITVDIHQDVVAIGGEYHADAEQILVEKYNSKRSDVWGGGYNILTKSFECNAILNLKPLTNNSVEILDQKARDRFLEVAKNKLKDIESLV